MPVLVLWIALAVAAGTVTLATGWAISKWLKVKQTIAFIGRSQAGKTTLIHVLEYGDVPGSDLAPTVDQTHSRKVTIEDLTVFVLDSGGDRLTQWESAVKKSAGVVYFFDANLVARGDPEALSALSADAEHIGELLSHGSLGVERKFTLVGTHSDQFLSKSDIQSVRKNKEVQRLRNACDIGDDDVIIGSLANKREALRVASAVAKRQSKGKK